MKISLEDFRMVDDDQIKAITHVVINEGLVIQNVILIKDKDEYFVEMPAMPRSDGSYVDLVRPLTKEITTNLTKTILEAFNSGEYNSGALEKLHITDVIINKVDTPNSKMKAVASVILNDELSINCIRIVETEPGNPDSVEILMPDWKIGDQWVKVAYFKNKSLTIEFINKILYEYKNI